MAGVLRRCEKNPRYFTDDSGEAIYLTGAHTWMVFQDAIVPDHPERSVIFDYEGYLDRMQAGGQNFLRLWCRESSIGMGAGRNMHSFTEPLPYRKVGQRENGCPVFDLTQFNEEYFTRLRQRVIQAGERGIYVSIMLFEAWSVDSRPGYIFDSHPYYRENNINGIDGNPAPIACGALSGENDKNPFVPTERILVHTLDDPKITALQKNYVKKVIETVNDLDNVMYEIANEALRWSRYWQYEMIDFIHETEKMMEKRHPVWMSHLVPAQNESLWIGHAEALSPGVESTADDYCINPPAADGSRVILADTDHLGGIWGTSQWVWKSFLRGLNPIFMDDISGKQPEGSGKAGAEQPTPDGTAGPAKADVPGRESEAENPVSMLFGRYQYGLPEDWEEPVRTALGRAAFWAKRIDLTAMVPAGWASSTGYCLADPGREYLIYQPESGSFKVNLYGADATFVVEWYRIETDEIIEGRPFSCGMAIDFTPPCPGEVLLHLKRA